MDDISRRRIVIVGPGRVGLSLAADLALAADVAPAPGLTPAADVASSGDAGPIAVVGRTARPPFLDAFPAVAYSSCGEIGVGPDAEAGSTFAPLALVFCVPDREVAAAAEAWAARLAAAPMPPHPPPAHPPPGLALHTSGTLPSAVLSPLRVRCGLALGSWHPLAALATPASGAFVGATIGIEGDPAAMEFGEWLAATVGARPIRVPPEAKTRYHAAAVLASNALVACFAAATEELRAAVGGGIPDDALLSLARSALDNVERIGLPAGVTGPIARGDARTVRAHLAALDPGRRALYRALGRQLLAVVEPRLAPECAIRVREALNSNPE